MADNAAVVARIQKLGDRCIGAGAFGAVYMGVDPHTGELVAVKEVPLPGTAGPAHPDDAAAAAPYLPNDDTYVNPTAFSVAVRNEIEVMRRAKDHPNLIRYVGVRPVHSEQHGGTVVQLIMEYCPGGSVAGLLGRLGVLREPLAARYTSDVLHALAHLHDTCRVCHRDVKPENVLLLTTGRAKLSDYGASKTLVRTDGQSTMLRTCVGSALYMAPEVVRGDPYDAKADVWSLGVLVCAMLTGRAPDYGLAHNPMALLYRVGSDDAAVPRLRRQGDPATASGADTLLSLTTGSGDAGKETVAPIGYSDAAADFVDACCSRDPHTRLSAAQLLRHPWIRAHTDGEAARPASPQDALLSLRPEEADKTTVNDPVDTSFLPGDRRDEQPAELPRCQHCRDAIALFSCDQCRAVPGCANRLCPACWEQGHAHVRAKSHCKAPLLVLGGGGGEGSPERSVPRDLFAALVQADAPSGARRVDGRQPVAAVGVSYQQLFQPPPDDAADVAPGEGTSLLLPTGAFVDLYGGAEGVEWSCGRCGQLNPGGTRLCQLCQRAA